MYVWSGEIISCAEIVVVPAIAIRPAAKDKNLFFTVIFCYQSVRWYEPSDCLDLPEEPEGVITDAE